MQNSCNELRATIRDVAEKSGVSISTVSRVINGHPAVSNITLKKVNDVIKRLQYSPSRLAKSLSGSGFDAVSVVYTRSAKTMSDSLYFNIIVNAIGTIAEENDFDLLMQSSESEEKDIEKTLRLIRDRLIKGVILLSSHTDNKFINILAKKNFPTAVIGKFEICGNDQNKNIIRVDTDNFNDSYNVGKYFIENGHRKIACIHAELKHYVAVDRLGGFSKALGDSNIILEDNMKANGGHTFDSAYKAALQLLCEQKDVTAVFATDDLKALALYQAARQLSIKIPDNLSVIGYNDYIFSKNITPPLTTVSVPIYDMGIVASTKLFSMIKKQEISFEDVIMPVDFKIRSSVRKI